MQNGHHPKDPSLNPATSVNKSAHGNNAHPNPLDVEPPTPNGVHDSTGQANETLTSLEANSTISYSDGNRHSIPPSSSQSALADDVDRSGMETEQSSFGATQAIMQQPTSDLREEMHHSSVEQRVQPADSSSHHGSSINPESANDILLEESNVVSPGINSPSEPITLQPDQEDRLNAAVSSRDGEASLFNDGRTSSPPNKDQAVTMPAVSVSSHLPAPLHEGEVLKASTDPISSPDSSIKMPAPISNAGEPTSDQVMHDVPSSSAKLVHEREDDDLQDGRAPKRSKTDERTPSIAQFKVPERPAMDMQVNGTHTEAVQNATPAMTQLQHKYLAKAIQNVKRIQSAAAFRNPVDYVALNIPTYPSVITKPMDLRTLEENLKFNHYPTVDAFVADFNQIVENCHIFNGPTHSYSKNADDMRASFDKHMEKLPGPNVAEPISVEKKKKTIAPAVPKAASRRESRSSLPGAARSPVSAGSPQTFALGPQGVPLIRRDSTVGDGRPKREIHPPAPRDLPYANQKPRKKKYQWELKFCEKVLSELSKPKYISVSYPFMGPVDPVALNIPTYHNIIKKPMDFGTMKTKLDHGEYENAKEFEMDARLVFQNCYRFNPPPDMTNTIGHQFEKIFDEEWSKKRDWIEANTPGSGPQSPGSSPEPEDSDEEEDEEDEEEEEQTELSKLQQQIAAMSRQVELITRKKKSPPASNKKSIKGSKPVNKHNKKAAPVPVKMEKKGPSRPAKKEKTPYVTYEQKQDISNRINSLSETKMATALKIIRDNMPNLKVRCSVENC